MATSVERQNFVPVGDLEVSETTLQNLLGNRIMMSLGTFFQFSISNIAYQSLEKNLTFRWATIELIGSVAHQFSGVGEKEITLEGVSYPIHNGLWHIEVLEIMAEQGVPYVLIAANGNVAGRYFITSLRETQSNFHVSGIPIKSEFVIRLKKYQTEYKRTESRFVRDLFEARLPKEVLSRIDNVPNTI